MELKLGDVQETMLIPLAVRAMETMQSKPRITDKKAVGIIEALGINTNQYKKFFTYEEKQS